MNRVELGGIRILISIYSGLQGKMNLNASLREHIQVINTIQLGDLQVDANRLADLCRQYGVRELSIFGSAARGKMRPDSDIDLLVEFLPNANVGLIEHASLMLDLERLLGKKVDLVSKNGLKPRIRSSVLADARLVYAA